MSCGAIGTDKSKRICPQENSMGFLPKRVLTLPKAEPIRWMKSSTTAKFREAYAQLPSEVQRSARKQFYLWQQNPHHPSVQFKAIGELWLARVTQDYRALAICEGNTYFWFWLGTHAEYDRIRRRQ